MATGGLTPQAQEQNFMMKEHVVSSQQAFILQVGLLQQGNWTPTADVLREAMLLV